MLPNLIIIGAMKSGTTSLHYYLSLHPQISMSKTKELSFFIKERNWHKGLTWYESHFMDVAKIHGESTPGYTSYPLFEDVPQRIYSVIPNAKLIYIVRDPVERIISDYIHNVANGREKRSFKKTFADLRYNEYVYRSRYFTQVEQFLEYFPKSNLLILTGEDLHNNRRTVLQRTFRFLDVDDTFSSPKFFLIRHRSIYKRQKNRLGLLLTETPIMKRIHQLPHSKRWIIEWFIYFPFSRKVKRPVLDENLRRELVHSLQREVDRLRSLTGCKFEEWRL